MKRTHQLVLGYALIVCMAMPILAEDGNKDALYKDLAELTLPSSINNLYEGVELPTKGAYGSIITWRSGNIKLLSNEGKVVGTPKRTRKRVTLTATLTKGEATAKKTFNVSARHQNLQFIEDLSIIMLIAYHSSLLSDSNQRPRDYKSRALAN